MQRARKGVETANRGDAFAQVRERLQGCVQTAAEEEHELRARTLRAADQRRCHRETMERAHSAERAERTHAVSLMHERRRAAALGIEKARAEHAERNAGRASARLAPGKLRSARAEDVARKHAQSDGVRSASRAWGALASERKGEEFAVRQRLHGASLRARPFDLWVALSLCWLLAWVAGCCRLLLVADC
jgi:hypothetical protein